MGSLFHENRAKFLNVPIEICTSKKPFDLIKFSRKRRQERQAVAAATIVPVNAEVVQNNTKEVLPVDKRSNFILAQDEIYARFEDDHFFETDNFSTTSGDSADSGDSDNEDSETETTINNCCFGEEDITTKNMETSLILSRQIVELSSDDRTSTSQQIVETSNITDLLASTKLTVKNDANNTSHASEDAQQKVFFEELENKSENNSFPENSSLLTTKKISENKLVGLRETKRDCSTIVFHSMPIRDLVRIVPDEELDNFRKITLQIPLNLKKVMEAAALEWEGLVNIDDPRECEKYHEKVNKE